MLKRTITGFVLTLIILPLLYFGGAFYTALIAILSYVAGYEILNMVNQKDNNFSRLRFVAPLWNVLLIISFIIFNNIMAPIMVFIVGILCFLSLMILRPHFSVQNVMILVLNFVYTGLLFFFLMYLREVTNTNYSELNKFKEVGLFKVLYLLITVVLTDIGAYTFGSLFGKRKLCPTISPNKTIAGFVGGLLLSVACGIGFYMITSRLLDIYIFGSFKYLALEIIVVIISTILLSLASTIGDLVASKLKRTYEIKDYGKIFPGHGGVMDRFDSTIFAATMFMAILILLGL